MSEELENKEFDRSIQNKFSESKTSVPDYLWTSIEKEAALLETTSLRKRVAWYRWTILSLVVLLGGIVLFYQLDENLTGKDIISEVGTKEQIIDIENKTPEITEEVEFVSESKQEKTPTIVTQEEISKVFASKLKNEDEEPVEHENKLSEEIAFEERIESEQQVKEIINDDNANNSSSNREEENEETNIIEPVVEVKENEPNQNPVKEKESNVAKNKVAETEEVIQPNEIEEVASALHENDSSIVDSFSTNETASSIPAVVATTEKKALSKIVASLFILPNFSSRGFEASSGTHDIYKTGDETKFRFSFGANVGYRISDRITMKFGVGYHKLKNEIGLNNVRPKELPILMNPVNSSITIYSSMGTVVANDIGSFEFAGDDEDDEDLDDEDDFASLNYKEEQEFTLLDIPLAVGYEIGKGKLKLLVEGGIVTSILIISKSKIEIGNVYSPDNLVTVEDYHQTKKMVLGGTVGVGAKYNISRRFSIIGLPSYNTSFMDINKDNASKIRPNSINFSLGLQFQF